MRPIFRRDEVNTSQEASRASTLTPRDGTAHNIQGYHFYRENVGSLSWGSKRLLVLYEKARQTKGGYNIPF